jgi:predicted ATP-binding protein involved in virulence
MAHKKNLEDVSKKLSDIHKDYDEAKKHVEVWQEECLESLAESKAKMKNGTNVGKEREKLMMILKQQKQASNIRQTKKNSANQPQQKYTLLMMRG